jgi:chemotaxis protein CheD
MHKKNMGCIEHNAMEQKQMKPNAVSMMTAVNFSEMKISNNPAETLVAFSIGSGIGLAVFDPISGIGGVLNFMLPDSTKANGVNPEKVPLMFADTGVPFFIKALLEQGAQPDRMKVVIAGGGHILDQTGIFNIGEKNCTALKKGLANYGLKIHHEDTGGTHSRTLCLEIGSGISCIKVFGQGEVKV